MTDEGSIPRSQFDWPEEEFVAKMREVCRGSKILNEVAWTLVKDRGCESFAELYNVLDENGRTEAIEGLEELGVSLSPAGMRSRLR